MSVAAVFPLNLFCGLAVRYCAGRETWIQPLYLVASLMYTSFLRFTFPAVPTYNSILPVLVNVIRLLQGGLQFGLQVKLTTQASLCASMVFLV